MVTNSWRRRLAAAFSAGALTISAASLFAVEMANITALDGPIPEVDLPTVSIESGQSTPDFFVDSAIGVGVYPVRIGEDSTDDFFNGVMLGTIRENHRRTNSLGQSLFVANSVALSETYSVTSPPNFHGNGAVFTMGDSAVRLIFDDIDSDVFTSLFTREGADMSDTSGI